MRTVRIRSKGCFAGLLVAQENGEVVRSTAILAVNHGQDARATTKLWTLQFSCLVALAAFWLVSVPVVRADPASPPDAKDEKKTEKPQDKAADPAPSQSPEKAAAKEAEQLRSIRVAIFDVDVLRGIDVEGPALADHLNTTLAAMSQVTVINRDQLEKVADERRSR